MAEINHKEFTRKEAFYALRDKCKRHHDVTSNGIAFTWDLAGMDGASFTLLKETKHTDGDINFAKSELRSQRDVVSIRIEAEPK